MQQFQECYSLSLFLSLSLSFSVCVWWKWTLKRRDKSVKSGIERERGCSFISGFPQRVLCTYILTRGGLVLNSGYLIYLFVVCFFPPCNLERWQDRCRTNKASIWKWSSCVFNSTGTLLLDLYRGFWWQLKMNNFFFGFLFWRKFNLFPLLLSSSSSTLGWSVFWGFLFFFCFLRRKRKWWNYSRSAIKVERKTRKRGQVSQNVSIKTGRRTSAGAILLYSCVLLSTWALKT